MASTSRAETQARTRQLVLEAAQRRFLEHGFAATSLDDIAREAGFSKGAVYSNFAGKSDLFLAIVEAQFADLTERLRAAVRGDTDVLARLSGVAEVYEEYLRLETGWSRWFPELAALAGQDVEARTRFAAVVRGMEEAIAEVVAETQASLEVAPALPARETAAIIVALVIGMTVRSLHDLETSPALFQLALTRLLLPDLT